MPELPEVETVRAGLEKILIDRPVIERFEFHRKDLRDPMPIRQIRKLEGQRIEEVLRRSKYLLFQTRVGFLLSHLGMTGSWRVAQKTDVRPHDHVVIHFAGGLRLVYRDPRRFGILDCGDDLGTHPRLRDLGPEPLSKDFTAETLWERLRGRESPIKNILMDAATVVGVGNIYASEALFRAGIRPSRLGGKLRRDECERLVGVVREVLREAIEAGGSSISDYVQASGETGFFQSKFRVYDRAGEACVSCGTQVKRSVIGGRSSFHCPKCQK